MFDLLSGEAQVQVLQMLLTIPATKESVKTVLLMKVWEPEVQARFLALKFFTWGYFLVQHSIPVPAARIIER